MNLITDLCFEKVVGIRNRNNIYPIKKGETNFDADCFGKKFVDAYHSAYMFSMEMEEYIKSTGSVTNYNGSISSSYLFWDLDDKEDLEQAQIDTRELLGRLYYLGAEEDNIQIFFSGRKGFHILLASKDISKYNGSAGLQNITRGVCESIAEGLKSLDSGVYDKTRLIRVCNSKHAFTGLYKIPITQYDLNNKNMSEIQEMAKEQVERETELIPCSLDYVVGVLKGLVSNGIASKKNPLKTSKHDLSYGMANGFKEGERNVGLTSVAGFFHSRGLRGEMLYNTVSLVNDKGNPVSEDDLMTIVKSVERYPVKPEYLQPEESDFVTMREAGEKWAQGKLNRNDLETGFKHLNKLLYTFDIGKSLLFVAKSGVGKTNLAMQVADMLAQSLGGLNLFCTLEMEASAVFYRAAKIDCSKEKGDVDNITITELMCQDENIRKKVSENWENTIMVDKDSLSIDQIETYFIKAQEKYGNKIKVLLIDYLGLIANTEDQKKLAIVAKQIKAMAKRLKTRIIVVGQLSRKAGDGTLEVTMDMIRDSGAVEDAGDIIVGMWCDPKDVYRVHCKSVKNREGIKNAKFDLLQHGVAYTEADYSASAIDIKPGRNWDN